MTKRELPIKRKKVDDKGLVTRNKGVGDKEKETWCREGELVTRR